jgi:hypothetical protein
MVTIAIPLTLAIADLYPLEGLDDVDNVFASFAEPCASAGDPYALSRLKAPEIISSTDALIDDMYANPRPVSDLYMPAIAVVRNVRSLIFHSAYNIQSWPGLAQHLHQAMQGNLTGVVNATMPKIDTNGGNKPDGSGFLTYPIWVGFMLVSTLFSSS